MKESLQHKLGRVRSPRVQITYDVEIGNAIVMKEIPFVIGILADLCGAPSTPLPKLKERKFIEIDRDTFDDVMEKLSPRVAFHVENHLASDQDPLGIELRFHSMEDFTPLNVVKQVSPLESLYNTRTHLKDLLTKLDGNDALEALLHTLMNSPEDQEALKAELEPSTQSSGT